MEKRWPRSNDLLAWGLYAWLDGILHVESPSEVLHQIREIQREPKQIHKHLYHCYQEFRDEFLSPDESVPKD